jgi:carboxymethylenebutenolidase
MTQESRTVITQAMIDAYDEFTHKSFDRRAFMEKLTGLAGSAAAAAAIAPLLAANPAMADIVAADDTRLTTQNVTFGDTVKGYLARPKGDAKLPGVIVIHENRGLNAHIKDVARRLALEGFVAVAPDLLSPQGGTPANEDDARALFGKLDPAQTAANCQAALKYLTGRPDTIPAVGAVGFCWGGGTVNNFATKSPDLKAGVAYYGGQPPAADVANIKAAMLLHYGGLDERIDAGIPAYEAALKAGSKTYEIHVYDGANHAFNNDTSEARYNKAAADEAWGRTVAWFKKYLVA